MSSKVACEMCEFYAGEEIAFFIAGGCYILCQKCIARNETLIRETEPIAD